MIGPSQNVKMAPNAKVAKTSCRCQLIFLEGCAVVPRAKGDVSGRTEDSIYIVSFHARYAIEPSRLTPTPVKSTGSVSWLVVAPIVLGRLTESVVHGQRAGPSAATDR